MRHLFLLLFLLIPSLSWAQPDQDDGLLWIALNLIDTDQAGSPVIQDNWLVPCSDKIEPGVIPHGFKLESSDRDLPEGMCEQELELHISGWINDQFVTRKSVLWQPGENGSRMIGVPREMTTRVKIMLPELIEINDRVYHSTEPIILRLIGSERMVVVAAPLRQLTRLTLSGADTDPSRMFGRSVIENKAGQLFLMPDAQSVRAPAGHLLDVRLTDRSGATRQITPAIRPEPYVDLVAVYGYEYHIEVVPKRPTRVAKRSN